MYQNGKTKDLGDRKSIRQYRHHRETVISEQRGKITGMVRMFAIAGIIVRTGIGKWILSISGTCCTIMDMEPKYICSA